MCGIAGILNLNESEPPLEGALRSMLGAIRHRGPDEFGIYLDECIGLGNARLSVVDLMGGQQPIGNEDGTLWIVFNGEIFNHVELRGQLERRGHSFSTYTDTEVLLHLFEEEGLGAFGALNGQWALALWDARQQKLILARDRLGVRPLFYVRQGRKLYFGSEIKALLASDCVSATIDPVAIGEIFKYWCPLSPRTSFQGIQEVPPAHYLIAQGGEIRIGRYWQLEFPLEGARSYKRDQIKNAEQWLEEFRELLIDATRIRLRADVPVGAYLSGGLDSSTIAAIIRGCTTNRLDTFSIAFTDRGFDESAFQRRMARFLGTEHHVIETTHADIAEVFPEVIWHTEVPLTRTAPAPMFLLSRLVRQHGYKVVLTGEGADEFLGGYDIFKEAKVRRFWARFPDSGRRSLLLKRLYPDIEGLAKSNHAYLAAFFRDGLNDTDSPFYSHAIRWRNNRRSLRFLRNDDSGLTELAAPSLPVGFMGWDPTARAQYLEIAIFLSQYLLCSQGDRVGMAHSIEGRFPFLDHRVVEFCTRLPSTLKMRGLTEKYLLKRLGRGLLPEEIWKRTKRPYRAPIHRSFFHGQTPEYVKELLSFESLNSAGLFKTESVAQLVRKIEQGKGVGETDDMALAGILSTQLLHHLFVAHFNKPEPLSGKDHVKVVAGANGSPIGK